MQHNSLLTKPHYPILDGLRGVAALTVVIFHLFEAHATSSFDQIINHGYLAVDFFFLLSGFVIGYAYDDRWEKMTLRNFFTRRLVRLQPMVVMGSIIGAIFFYMQAGAFFSLIGQTPIWKMLLIMVLGCIMLPIPPSMDIRGWSEIYPLNGPAWSLFFEYIANILYALFIRRFSKTLLTILVIASAGFLIHLALTNPHGDVIGGWALDATQLHIGFARLLYPFFAGLLLFRIVKVGKIKNAFFWCSLLVVVMLAMPRIGDKNHVWMNGLYDSFSIILVFPVIIYMGASGTITAPFAKRISKFLGDISYPIYITHYPLIYVYTAWVQDKKIPLKDGYPIAIATFIAAVILAYACLKLYDEPVRKWLGKKLLPAKTKNNPQKEKATVE